MPNDQRASSGIELGKGIENARGEACHRDPGFAHMAESSSPDGSRMRLQRFLARAGVASRRKSEDLIEQGKVSVNGRLVTEVGTTVDPLADVVEFEGRRVRLPEEAVVIMLNKPKGFISAMEDERERTVAELVPVDEHPGLFPIGRLDRDTTGLLLFTTDGELGHRLLHPSMGVTKRYEAIVEGIVTDDEAKQLSDGIELEDGPTAPARCEVLATSEERGGAQRLYGIGSSIEPDKPSSHVVIEINEGRKRQVRRMFDAIGHHVLDLRRTDFGPVSLEGLSEGQWRVLKAAELEKLNAVQSKRASR